MQPTLPHGGPPRPRSRNILDAGLLIARSALAREESRGAHYRLDFPLKNDLRFQKHSIVRGDRSASNSLKGTASAVPNGCPHVGFSR